MTHRRPAALLDEEGLFNYALKSLGSRALSTGELRLKLKRRAASAADVEKVLARLKEYGYLNDKLFAELFASRRLENEGFGKSRVLADLRAKRVAPSIAEKAVHETFADTDEVALIEGFLARKYRRQPLSDIISEPKGLASAYRKLRAAGFSHTNSMRVLKGHGKDAEILDALDAQSE